MTLIINAFQSTLEGTGLDLRFSSSPRNAISIEGAAPKGAAFLFGCRPCELAR